MSYANAVHKFIAQKQLSNEISTNEIIKRKLYQETLSLNEIKHHRAIEYKKKCNGKMAMVRDKFFIQDDTHTQHRQ